MSRAPGQHDETLLDDLPDLVARSAERGSPIVFELEPRHRPDVRALMETLGVHLIVREESSGDSVSAS